MAMTTADVGAAAVSPARVAGTEVGDHDIRGGQQCEHLGGPRIAGDRALAGREITEQGAGAAIGLRPPASHRVTRCGFDFHDRGAGVGEHLAAVGGRDSRREFQYLKAIEGRAGTLRRFVGCHWPGRS